jgi:hypothetical protein
VKPSDARVAARYSLRPPSEELNTITPGCGFPGRLKSVPTISLCHGSVDGGRQHKVLSEIGGSRPLAVDINFYVGNDRLIYPHLRQAHL